MSVRRNSLYIPMHGQLGRVLSLWEVLRRINGRVSLLGGSAITQSWFSLT